MISDLTCDMTDVSRPLLWLTQWPLTFSNVKCEESCDRGLSKTCKVCLQERVAFRVLFKAAHGHYSGCWCQVEDLAGPSSELVQPDTVIVKRAPRLIWAVLFWAQSQCLCWPFIKVTTHGSWRTGLRGIHRRRLFMDGLDKFCYLPGEQLS